jgi:hypothetical protein
MDPVRQVQFVQNNRVEWEVLVEMAPSPPADNQKLTRLPAIADRLTTIVRRTFGQECRVEIRYVDEIPRVSGKLRYYRSSEVSDR